MATRIIPQAGFDPSCGDFGVSVVHKQSNPNDSNSIKVEYDEWIDLDHTLHCATIPWNGGELSVIEVRRLLDSANVPVYIQDVSAIGMIFECVEGILKESKEDDGMSNGLFPSILVRISSDKETFDLDTYEFEYYALESR